MSAPASERLAAFFARQRAGEKRFVDQDLSALDLAGVDLSGADLSGADLRGARLRGANLSGAVLKKANLRDADLRDAILAHADLREVEGLINPQLGGSDLRGALLPEGALPTGIVDAADNASAPTQTLFLSMLGSCAYAWLAIAMTTDAHLLTDSNSSPLPFISTSVPIAAFYVATPLLLLGVYVYFQLYLQRLWEAIASLPAVFPDGRPLDQKVSPWLLNGLLRPQFVRLGDRPPLSSLQAGLGVLLAWGVVPATLLGFWARYLPRHDCLGTFIQAGMFVTALVFAVVSMNLSGSTLRRETFAKRSLAARAVVMGLLGIVALGFVSTLGIPAHGHGVEEPPSDSVEGFSARIRQRIDDLRCGHCVAAVLSGEEVSIKESGSPGKAEAATVRGAPLRRGDLRYARAEGAFLVNADLREADFASAKLMAADLRGADLHGANLNAAELRGSDLRGANLYGADLRRSSLFWARLQKANLAGANLERANLFGACLRGTKGLVPAQVRAAARWEFAFYDDDLREQLKLPADHNENLKSALADLSTQIENALKRLAGVSIVSDAPFQCDGSG
ncbi:MAG TPA: pentapeptide repeat-containing protein [Candidatus Binatia bacterium]|nr:pentapeptide repeat-containing protein [Candidatus Binatia bacterium]